MSTIPALNAGLLGIQRGLSALSRNAAEIASAEQYSSGSPAGLATPLVKIIENRLHIQASAKVIERTSEALGSLIDIQA